LKTVQLFVDIPSTLAGMGAVEKSIYLPSDMPPKRFIPTLMQIRYKVHTLLHEDASSPAVVKTYQRKEMMS
jgi:hypothetical protein